MQIPVGFGQITHFFGGPGLDRGAAVVYGIDLGAVLDPAVAAESAHTIWTNIMLALQTIDCELHSTLCKFGPNDTGNFATFSAVAAGTGVGAMAPPNTAALIEKVTVLGGRKGRGRMYVPGIADANVEVDGSLTPAFRTQVGSQATDFLNALDTDGIPMTLLHNDSTAPSLVTALQADARAATQRRRLRG